MSVRRPDVHRRCAPPPLAARTIMGTIGSLVRCRRGVVSLEFVIVAPFLFLLLFAITFLGIALNNYLMLTAAAEQGAQVLSLGRGTTTPFSTAKTAITSANLTAANITVSVKIAGSVCSGDSACGALLTPGAVALVGLSYPCNLTFMGFSFGGSPCNLSAQSAAIVQ
jgi:Flp pilus assembly protein TadG